MTELKPCPFCGGKMWPSKDSYNYWGPDGQHHDGCILQSCDFFDYANKVRMVNAWNTRAPAPDVAKAIRAAIEEDRRGRTFSPDEIAKAEARGVERAATALEAWALHMENEMTKRYLFMAARDLRANLS